MPGWANISSGERVEVFDNLNCSGSLRDHVIPARIRLQTVRKTLPDVFQPVDVLRKDGARFAEGFAVMNVRNRKDTQVEAKTPGRPFDHRLRGRIYRFP